MVIGVPQLGVLILMWVLLGVGAMVRWQGREICIGAATFPVLMIGVLSFPIGPIALLGGWLFLKYRADKKVKRLVQKRLAKLERTSSHADDQTS